MSLAGSILFFLGIVLIYYVYDGYGRVLTLLSRFAARTDSDYVSSSITVSVILPVYNERDNIRGKLDNLLRQKCSSALEIIVVSDGSDDGTDDVVREYFDNGVRLVNTTGRIGKSLAQNIAVAEASGEVLVLTDTAVHMNEGCIEALVSPLSDPRVGCTTANLLFHNEIESDTGDAVGFYWNYELKIRRLESQLGLLATASGPAMAVRRSLWKDLKAEYGDDCVLPLDVVLQGKRVIHVNGAVARDVHFADFRREFRARSRMTIRNWIGTFSRSQLLNPLKFPGFAFALWSHKVLRWLSPVYILLAAVGLVLIGLGSGIWWPAEVFGLLVLLGGLGIALMAYGVRLPGLSLWANFLLANAGFAQGLFQVAFGKKIRVYDNKQTA